MDSIEILTILSFGFFGSLGHCIGMCGGFIVTYTSTKIDPQSSRVSQSINHLLYNGGRISSYMLLGALFGAFGSLWEATPLLRAVMFTIAGILMILMGLSLTGKLRFLNSIEYNLTQKKWFKKLFQKLITGNTRSSFYFLGALNGLFPCGLVYAALVWAMATASPIYGAFVMLLFGLATLPSLFSFGFFIGILKQTQMRKVMLQLAALTVIAFGTWTLFKAYVQFDKHLHPKTTPELMEQKGHSCCH